MADEFCSTNRHFTFLRTEWLLAVSLQWWFQVNKTIFHNSGEVQAPVFAIVLTPASSPCRISCLWDGVVRKGGWWEENDTYTTCTDEFQPSRHSKTPQCAFLQTMDTVTLWCCDNAVLMVWLGVGTTATWLGFGKDHVLTWKQSCSTYSVV